jgi:hypothetical protein
MAVQTNIVPNNTNASGTVFSGPVVSGDKFGANVSGLGPDVGLSVCMQQAILNFNGATAVSVTTYFPKHSVLIDVLVDTLTAWNSATSDTLSVGTAAAGTQYVSGVDVKAAASRIRPTFTAAQLAAMQDTASETVVATVTPVGAASAGQTVVTYIYAQTVNWQNP